eukprot:scaffold41668_cov63-Phaeocystis_antarctica.AAC.2
MPRSASDASGTNSIGEPTMLWHMDQTLMTASLAGVLFWAGAAAASIFLRLCCSCAPVVGRFRCARTFSRADGISQTLAPFQAV